MSSKSPVVRRISLSGKKSDSKKEASSKAEAKEDTQNAPKKAPRTPKAAKVAASPLIGIVRYVKGSWHELRQVRWPNRSATWSLTLAVIIFTLFFAVIILLLDFAFQYLFKEVLLR